MHCRVELADAVFQIFQMHCRVELADAVSPPPTLLLPSNETSARARLRKIRSNCRPMTQGVRCWTYSCPPENLRGPRVVLECMLACALIVASCKTARGLQWNTHAALLARARARVSHAPACMWWAGCLLRATRGQGKACDQPAISDDACCLLSRACPWASALCTPRCGQASLGEK